MDSCGEDFVKDVSQAGDKYEHCEEFEDDADDLKFCKNSPKPMRVHKNADGNVSDGKGDGGGTGNVEVLVSPKYQRMSSEQTSNAIAHRDERQTDSHQPHRGATASRRVGQVFSVV
jgi:hypothetical protein